MDYRFATSEDVPLLAQLNAQLIADEKHGNTMSVAELEVRMRAWLAGEYTAVLFERTGDVVAYALYRCEESGIYLRHFLTLPEFRHAGIGREAIRLLRNDIWPPDARLTLHVLLHNARAIAFWRSVGFADYAMLMELQNATGCGEGSR